MNRTGDNSKDDKVDNGQSLFASRGSAQLHAPVCPPLVQPTLLARTIDIEGSSHDGNFTQGCAFSPDGLCVLTSTASDNILRLYDTPPSSCPAAAAAAAAAAVSKAREYRTGEEDSSLGSVGDTHNADKTDRSTGRQWSGGAIHSWRTALRARGGGDAVRSYDWYPRMNSSDPNTCAFIAASRDQPIHLIDAYNGSIRATYSPYNELDEMESPTVVKFSPDGRRIFASGFKSDRTVHVFRTALPGRGCHVGSVWRLGKSRRSRDGQKGMVSAVAFPNTGNTGISSGNDNWCGRNVFAVGTYAPGSIYLYDDRTAAGMCGEINADDEDDGTKPGRKGRGSPLGTVLMNGLSVVGHGRGYARKKRRFVDIATDQKTTGTKEVDAEGGNNDLMEIFSAAKVRWYQSRARGGITQLNFSPGYDEYVLYSASRRSDSVLAWDLRMLSDNAELSGRYYPIRGFRAFRRDGDTNQRLEFDLDETGRTMFVCSRDKSVKIYDVQTGNVRGVIDFGLDDVANGVSYMPNSAGGGGLLAVAIGARRFPDNYDELEGGVDIDSGGISTNGVPPGALELYRIDTRNS